MSACSVQAMSQVGCRLMVASSAKTSRPRCPAAVGGASVLHLLEERVDLGARRRRRRLVAGGGSPVSVFRHCRRIAAGRALRRPISGHGFAQCPAIRWRNGAGAMAGSVSRALVAEQMSWVRAACPGRTIRRGWRRGAAALVERQLQRWRAGS
jgi:hypothetical protein